VRKPFPAEFCRDVIAVARGSEASMAQLARDFGVSEFCLALWMKIADREDGRPEAEAHSGSLSCAFRAGTGRVVV